MREISRRIAIMLTALCPAAVASGTPPSGFVSKTIYTERSGKIAELRLPPEWSGGGASTLLPAGNETKDSSDTFVQQNTWRPRGSTGWHTHPGKSVIIVMTGTVTAYDGDDSSCTPHQYSSGMMFVDEGGDHVHLIRNESDSEARTITIQFISAGAVRRIDAPAPGNCHL